MTPAETRAAVAALLPDHGSVAMREIADRLLQTVGRASARTWAEGLLREVTK
jgi:hypothetical protein